MAPRYTFSIEEPTLDCAGDCYVEIAFRTNAPGSTKVVLQAKTRKGWRTVPESLSTRVRDGQVTSNWMQRPTKYRVVLKTRPRQVSRTVTARFDQTDIKESLASGWPQGDP